ncbi:MAG: class I SAM-dependent methyltransferase [Chloroflexi bacterium]|nr:class I SAM-dependent methyltransferase [Chloroflexota bacterium]
MKRIARSFFPQLYYSLYRAKKSRKKRQELLADARKLAKDATDLRSIDEILDHPLLCKAGTFRVAQKKVEISALLDLLKGRDIKTVCEVGTYRGGTIFLFSQVASPLAKLISIDLNMPRDRQRAIQNLVNHQQELAIIRGNSHQIETLEQVNRILKAQPVDFLFIDGDHSYSGVKKDFELYSPLVRTGGLITFHDICPDFYTRHAVTTNAYSGDVPQFWDELKTKYPTKRFREFIEDKEQDGYGIGVLYW